nr:hypothetical protein [Chloroflexota bacterium]
VGESADGRAIILGLVEVGGMEPVARARLAPELVPPGVAAVEADTLERPLAEGRAWMEENTLRVSLPPFGIATVRIEPGG